ncbi:MAG: DUF3147 family protein [Gemmatimonadota bacterium]|nr:MAG: DUF3147 family protein [Gemmatimonadota bacterium]
MNTLFFLKVVLSFVVGGLFVTACTVAAERFGSAVGGIIGGIPSTVVVTLFFIGLVESPHVASRATEIIPLIVGFNGLFLVAYAAFARRGFAVGLCTAFLVWGTLSFLAVRIDPVGFAVSLACYFFLLSLCYFTFQRLLHVPIFQGRNILVSPGQLSLRALFSGGIIALAVWLSRVSNPTIGGMFSVFPAVFISTLVIAYQVRGLEFSRALTKPMMISGMINVVVYAVCVRYLYLSVGIGLGTLLAFLISLVSAYGTYLLARSKQPHGIT